MHCKRKLGSLSTYAIIYLLRWVTHFRAQVQAHAQRTSVAEACRAFHISRPTFYTWQRTTPAEGEDWLPPRGQGGGVSPLPAVLQQYIVDLARLCPHLGTRRLADAITACTRYQVSHMQVWRLLQRRQVDVAARAAAPRRATDWVRFSGMAPHAQWQVDILYAYKVAVTPGITQWVYLIAVLDDHSRALLVARFYWQQSTLAGLDTLAEAVAQYGCPRQVVVDNGKQFHDQDFVWFCQQLGVDIRYCGQHHPQSKGKIERWFRTCRKEHLRPIPFVSLAHNQQRLEQDVSAYNHVYRHAGIGTRPAERLAGRDGASVARPVPEGVDLARLRLGNVKVQRVVSQAGCIKYKKQRYAVPGGVKGERVGIKEWGGELFLLGQGQIIATYPLAPQV